jgi:hypothetical protein
VARQDYIGNGVTTVFPYTFRLIDASHMRVILRGTDGVEVEQTLDVDFTLSGVGSPSGGSVTMTTAPANEVAVALLRQVPGTQLTDLRNQSAYYPETIEDAFDLSAMRHLQQQDAIERSLRLPESEAGSATLTILPPLAERKGKTLGFDPTTGQPSANVTSSTTVSAAMIPVVQAATLASARAAMGPWGDALVTSTGSSTARDLAKRFSETINVKDYGAVGDGVANDASAVNSAIAAAKSAAKTVYFPPGTYLVSGIASQSGRVHLCGNPGQSKIKGGFTYNEPSFPTSADTATPLDYSSPFFSCYGIDFENTATNGVGLVVQAQEQTKFLNTARIERCDFYGDTGLVCVNLIGFAIRDCRFFVKRTGTKFLGCTNGTVVGCHWNNQASFGVVIDYTSSGTGARAGGENIKFTACEWAVCQYGLFAIEHQWGVVEGCLFDYCTVPCYIQGCQNFKASNSYFGASTTMVTLGSGWPEYTANASTGVALYMAPHKTPALATIPCGGTFVDCEFIDYTGNNQPIVYMQGQPPSFTGTQCQQITLTNCLLLVAPNHSKSYLLVAEYTTKLMLVGNRFVAPVNNPTTILSPYSFPNCDTVSCIANDANNVLNASSAPVYGLSETLVYGAGTAGPTSLRIGANLVTYSGAAPASGTWTRGDVAHNSNAAVGQPKGWRCTVSGTPGTWVSEGNL